LSGKLLIESKFWRIYKQNKQENFPVPKKKKKKKKEGRDIHFIIVIIIIIRINMTQYYQDASRTETSELSWNLLDNKSSANTNATQLMKTNTQLRARFSMAT
jgi:hypothetical protein